MSGDFLDSNVILYMFARGDDVKRDAATTLVARAIREGGAISFQVVQEVLNRLLRMPGGSIDDAQSLLRDTLAPLWRVMPSQALYTSALATHSRYGYSFYDSLIVAAAQEAGCSRLLTEDLQHGQRIGRLTITNPFIAGGGRR
jgi:predicted nucleic acid-binding protein